jgi:hypothetical protein
MTAPACHSRGGTRVRWTPRPDGCEESVQFTPGYNCSDRSMQGHGVHGMEVCWHLRGPAGFAWLRMVTGWVPGELSPGRGLNPAGQYDLWDFYPAGGGLGYDARWPQYEGHEPSEDECPVLGAPCYRGMSLSGADEPVKRFVAEGEQVIWDALEAAYAELKTGPLGEQP